MVQTDLSQLASECTEWRQILRSYKDDFHDAKKALQEVCRKTLSKAEQLQVEHFDNQFHIQLINIHDLKQSIKAHERRVQLEGDSPAAETFAAHESLLTEFISLENTLQELRNEFRNFISEESC